MKKICIEWFPDRDKHKEVIGQIYSKGLEFAISTERQQVSHFVYCKDFLHDAVWAVLYDKEVEIHGFRFNPKIHTFNVNDFTRTLLANESDQFFKDRIPNCVEFLNKIEAVLHLKRTEAFECERPPEKYLPGGVFLLESSQRWMTAPPLLSLYTMLIRCGFVHRAGDDYQTTLNNVANGTVESYQTNDKNFVNDSMPAIKLIMELGYRKIFYEDMKKNYPENIETSDLHHRCGIISYSQGQTVKNFPYWHREELLKVLVERGIEIKNLWINPHSLPKVAEGLTGGFYSN
jgi:hypothetical protein